MFPILLRLLLAAIIAASAGFGLAVADKIVVGIEHVSVGQLGWLSMFLSALFCRTGRAAASDTLALTTLRSLMAHLSRSVGEARTAALPISTSFRDRLQARGKGM